MSKIENSKIINYINEVCSLVKNKKVHAEIRAELLCHINDTIEDYLEIGIPEDKAIDKALFFIFTNIFVCTPALFLVI